MTSHVAITDEGDVVFPEVSPDVDLDELQARLDQEEADRAAEAAERSIVERQKALELARIACRACPLKDFCVMGPVALVDALSKTGKPGNSTRQRFSRRVEKPDNKHSCDNNLRPGRLPKQ